MTRTRTAATFAPPVMEARRWLEGVSFPEDRPLINVSQAAPVDPPPLACGRPWRSFASQPARQRASLWAGSRETQICAQNWQQQIGAHYDADSRADQVAITSGCNQAFAAAISAITDEGDEVILPTPWYFNHKMWLDMAGVQRVDLKTGDDLLPDPERGTRPDHQTKPARLLWSPPTIPAVLNTLPSWCVPSTIWPAKQACA